MNPKLRLKQIFKIALFFSILAIISCKKGSDDSSKISVHRIKSMDSYNEGQWNWTAKFEYTGERISKVIFNYSSGTEEFNVQYPDNNSAKITYPDKTFKINFINQKVKEVIFEDTEYSEKYVIEYNLDGKVQALNNYSSPPNWTYDGGDTYSYNNGKLAEINCSPDPEEHRYAFSYNGELLNNCVYSYKAPAGLWTIYSTATYSYTNDKITKIVRTDGLSSDFSYDSFGNLSEKNEYYGSYHDKIIYTYEEGTGNYGKICEFFDILGPDFEFNEYREPQPYK